MAVTVPDVPAWRLWLRRQGARLAAILRWRPGVSIEIPIEGIGVLANTLVERDGDAAG